MVEIIEDYLSKYRFILFFFVIALLLSKENFFSALTPVHLQGLSMTGLIKSTEDRKVSAARDGSSHRSSVAPYLFFYVYKPIKPAYAAQ
jgi:hypothetical protein